MALNLRVIAAQLGGDVIGRDSVNVPGPGHSKADRSLSIKMDPRAPGGFVVYSHAGDDPIECRDYVRERLGMGSWHPNRRNQSAPLVVTDAGPDPKKLRNKEAALRIWHESVNPIGTLVEQYLREHRGLTLPSDLAGRVIRFHGSLYVDPQTRLPGMVCLYRDISTDEPTGIHRTFLTRDKAAKVDRKMLGDAKGAAIKLDPAADGVLTIGEGIETVMAAREAGYTPGWALGSSVAVKTFPVLRRANELIILEENDPTSRRDVKTCAKRYLNAKKPVTLVTSNVGNDFNDAWRAMK